MIVSHESQESLPLEGILGDLSHIWDADLKVIDEILRDEGFIDILWRSFRRNTSCAHNKGRKRLSVSLRLMCSST